MKQTAFCLFLLALLAGTFCVKNSLIASKSVTAHAIAMKGEPKYKKGFSHFDYVNPEAPKGGQIIYRGIGTFDSFHGYATRGVDADGSGLLYDSLMTSSGDELQTYYCLVAEKIEYTLDYKKITFYINPKARFQDGSAITSEDVLFSYTMLTTKSLPYLKQHFQIVQEAHTEGQYKISFTLSASDKERLLDLGTLPIFPKKYWEGKNFSDPLTEVPLGSGGYTVSDFKMGQYVVYKRLDDYWAKDLAVNKGLGNFDYIRYDYYRDQYVSLEAFKAGEFDFIEEYIAKNWATLYTGKNFKSGNIVKEDIPHEKPQRMQALIFNNQRAKFKNIRVRKALSLLFDFEWMNKNLFFSQYKRTRSFFQNTIYEADELPSKEELAILEPFRELLAPEVFTDVYRVPVNDGSGYNRDKIREALHLLKAAGYEVRNTKLVDVKSGKQFEFEFLTRQPSMVRVLIPYQRSLERVGIKMRIRMVDTTQYINRLKKSDFDSTTYAYSEYAYPNNGLAISFHSRSINPEYNPNIPGVSNPAIDHILDQIVAHQNDDEKLIHLGRAFDRVMMHSHYMVPQWHISSYRVAYWNKFSKPKQRPKYSLGVGSWWYDEKKAAALK